MSTAPEKLTPVSPKSPCPVCNGTHKCSVGNAGLIVCGRTSDPAEGFRHLGPSKKDSQFHLYRRADEVAVDRPKPRKTITVNWPAVASRCARAMTTAASNDLAAELGLPEDAAGILAVGFDAKDKSGPCWTFPERDGQGKVVGVNRRFRDGTKRASPGSARGLSIPDRWIDRAGPLLVVEGPSDTIALSYCKLPAVGRPSNTGGIEFLIDLLTNFPVDREVIILGERDEKKDGSWPGKEGAERTAAVLADRLARPIGVALPPAGSKDARVWITGQNLDPKDYNEWVQAGRRFMEEVERLPGCTGPVSADPLPPVAPELAPPPPLADEAFHGPIGAFARAVEPYTEADPAAVLAQTLVMFGSAVGRGVWTTIGSGRHGSNEFVLIVGSTAEGRKGESLSVARRLMSRVDDVWYKERVASGLSSGEGLIHAVRDATYKREKVASDGKEEYQQVQTDPGQSDKRLLVIESEFGSTLRQFDRTGNTLSHAIREAWDGNQLRVLTKTSGESATNPHVSIIGHITPLELRKSLSDVEAGNGLANRFLIVHAGRSKLLPDPPPVPDMIYSNTIADLTYAVGSARFAGEIPRSESARSLWSTGMYQGLSMSRAGVAGPLTARAPAHVLRLALIYALADGDKEVKPVHIRAAHALWAYSEASIGSVFGLGTGNSLADDIERLVRGNPAGVTRTDISNYFNRNKSKLDLDDAIATLIRLGRIATMKAPTNGRSATRYVTTRTAA